ncbi:hypothetical protein MCUN1_002295 [Malassezia cuniculi]|uniref:Large ribosomal subunit protein mL59 domain-containing protein n=1 Tax=Malassezia cuniculi TaxID=948313 RepID=A0AAF0EW58_9BASI|nr:hypothetical protein MCUN1_002295 [Malassezia cuniculi]
MAFVPSAVLRRGSPAEIVQGFLEWSARVRAGAPKVVGHTQSGDAEVVARGFRHWKNAETGRWNPPRYSLRRQAQLVRAAFATGQLDVLPSFKKRDQFVARLAEQPKHEVFCGIPVPSSIPWLEAHKDAAEALRIAKKEHTRGPYAGRPVKRMFKGHRVDREARLRRERVKENMARMDETVREWREERRAERAKTKRASIL